VFDEATGKHFHANDIRLNRIRETASNEMEYAVGGVSLEAVGSIPGSIFEEFCGTERAGNANCLILQNQRPPLKKPKS
jgi:hypothetical protein